MLGGREEGAFIRHCVDMVGLGFLKLELYSSEEASFRSFTERRSNILCNISPNPAARFPRGAKTFSHPKPNFLFAVTVGVGAKVHANSHRRKTNLRMTRKLFAALHFPRKEKGAKRG